MLSLLLLLLPFLSSPIAAAVTVSTRDSASGSSIEDCLGRQLSPGASIVHDTSGAPRWSEFDAPHPGIVVNVATEQDVLVTVSALFAVHQSPNPPNGQKVQYCIGKNIPFLAQGGGHGWATTFDLGRHGVLINLRGLRQITFNAEKTQMTFQGGAIVSEVVAAAYGNNTQVPTGNCNCVGMLGAVLGGSYGHLMGPHGFGVDNVLSFNLITANGNAITVTPDDTDLWWALRGAGPNFGIVTSATMKAYPTPADQSVAWLGIMTFTEDKIEALVQAINDLVLQPKMDIYMYYTTSGAPSYIPLVAALPFYSGSEADGKSAFASIYAVGPSSDGTTVTPYNQWNSGGAPFCVKGDRKPSYGAGLRNMVPATWRAIWNEYILFLANPGTGSTTVLLEGYSLIKSRSLPDSSSSFPFRSTINYNAVVLVWYTDPNLDAKAEAFGSKVRDLWRSTDNLASNSTYINFAFGDESLSTVYGSNVARLQEIKAEYDPHGRFDQWFPLTKKPERREPHECSSPSLFDMKSNSASSCPRSLQSAH